MSGCVPQGRIAVTANCNIVNLVGLSHSDNVARPADVLIIKANGDAVPKSSDDLHNFWAYDLQTV